ncbi:MAG: hypothetical protein JNK05_07040 [Myxococcales bacterium]|nr:hypothetical protein [Myxococcales bacterium]
MTAAPPTLFERVVAECGLAPAFARTAIERALRRANIEPAALTRSNLRSALPEIERTVTMYLGPRTPQAMARIEALLL